MKGFSNLVCHFNELSKNFDFDFFQQQGGMNEFRKPSSKYKYRESAYLMAQAQKTIVLRVSKTYPI